jgi:hypothetical protein
MQGLFHEIHRLLERHQCKPHIEIEARFGWKLDTYFDTNIQSEFYDNIYRKLDSPTLYKTDETSKVYIWKNMRIIVVNNRILMVQRKIIIEHVDLRLEGTPYDVRLSVCQEIPVKSYPENILHMATLIRERNRSTFQYKMWSYDLTSVFVPLTGETLYEFEIELNSHTVDRGTSPNYLAQSLALKIHDVASWTVKKCEIIHLKDVYRI